MIRARIVDASLPKIDLRRENRLLEGSVTLEHCTKNRLATKMRTIEDRIANDSAAKVGLLCKYRPIKEGGHQECRSLEY
jgi:hypothetical protein